MSDTLEGLAMEAENEAAIEIAEQAKNTDFEDEAPRPDLTGVFALLYKTLGEIVTARANVSALSEQEIGALANASNEVAKHYDLEVSPRVAAWIGLGSVSAAIALPRVAEYRQNMAVDVTPEAA